MAFDGSTWPGAKAPAKVWSPPQVFRPPPAPKLPPKPGYFGPKRTPQRIPFGKKVRLPKVTTRPPMRFPGWFRAPGVIAVGVAAVELLTPPTDYTVTAPAGWVNVLTCPPNNAYKLEPGFSHARVPCGGAISCLTLQAGPGPGVSSYGLGWPNCSVVNNCLQVIIADNRELTPGVYRSHYRYVFRYQCTLNPPLDPTTDAADWVVPNTRLLQPYSPPNPYADFPPLTAQPYPSPIPYRQLPYWPDPDHEILPSPGTPFPAPMPQPDPWVEPFPGVLPPVPAPRPRPIVRPAPSPAPGPRPRPAPGPGPRPAPGPQPGPAPRPSPRPTPPVTPPPAVPPPYTRPGTGVIYYYTKPTPGAQPRTRIREGWPQHRETRPSPREKEKKFRMGAAMSALWNATGQVTEAMDLINVAYGAMPCQSKYDAGLMKKGQKLDPVKKAAFIAANLDKMDATEFLRGKLKNDFEDMFFGLTSTERAQYGLSFRAGLNTRGGNSMQKRTDWNLEDPQENPILKAYNEGVDKLLGPRPKSHTCCGGKKNVCAKVAFGKQAKLARHLPRSTQQYYWAAIKAGNVASRAGKR